MICCCLLYSLKVTAVWCLVEAESIALGSTCHSDNECQQQIKSSQCNNNRCVCIPYHVVHNQTTCLPATLLGFSCLVDTQCTMKTNNSYCNEFGKCSCKSGHNQFRLHMCLKGANYNELCLNEGHCQQSSHYSYCKYIVPRIYGKCRCFKGYAAKNKICMPVLGSLCRTNNECQEWNQNAYCKKGERSSHCICKEGFYMSFNKLQCIPTRTNQLSGRFAINPMSLGKPCTHNLQCQMIDPYSMCRDWVCQCKQESPTCNLQKTGCYRDTFQCDDGHCISWYFVCDGRKHCKDGSDEKRCIPKKCPVSAFQCADGNCISRGALCNGVAECRDGSDELNCTSTNCDKRSFQCANGQCVSPYSFCNSILDCQDRSDEKAASCTYGERCPMNSFRCDNKRCRSTAVLCTSTDGCGDNSDETHCKVCSCPKPYP